jgi:hypothetical protein
MGAEQRGKNRDRAFSACMKSHDEDGKMRVGESLSELGP